MSSQRKSDPEKLSPLARMRRAVSALNVITADPVVAPEAIQQDVDARSALAKWRVNQKLTTARATANIEQLRRKAARKQARLSLEESTHEGNHRSTKTR